jgi:hypothetical protein
MTHSNPSPPNIHTPARARKNGNLNGTSPAMKDHVAERESWH